LFALALAILVVTEMTEPVFTPILSAGLDVASSPVFRSYVWAVSGAVGKSFDVWPQFTNRYFAGRRSEIQLLALCAPLSILASAITTYPVWG
jgi:hypothetical protein